MKNWYLLLLMGVMAVSVPANGDVIQLSNGDRVTGEILTSDAKTLTVKTELMGDVTIERSGIVSVRSEQPLNVTIEGGETVVGSIETREQTVRVRRQDSTEVTAPLASVTAIRNDAEQAAWEREQERLNNPGWRDFWSGAADLGLATARGNARTTTISTGFNASRETGFDRTRLTYSQIYSTQNTKEPYGATANRINGGARYDRDITGRLFAFSFGDFTFDEFQDLDLRSVLGGGLGWKIIDTQRTLFNFGAGGNWAREKFATGLIRNSGELNLGEESRHKLTNTVRLFQSISLYPNLSETGEFRMDFDGGMSAKLNSFLSWNVTISDRYLSNPLPGKKSNDLLLTTGISFTFSQE